jgi:hypothetical protein
MWQRCIWWANNLVNDLRKKVIIMSRSSSVVINTFLNTFHYTMFVPLPRFHLENVADRTCHSLYIDYTNKRNYFNDSIENTILPFYDNFVGKCTICLKIALRGAYYYVHWEESTIVERGVALHVSIWQARKIPLTPLRCGKGISRIARKSCSFICSKYSRVGWPNLEQYFVMVHLSQVANNPPTSIQLCQLSAALGYLVLFFEQNQDTYHSRIGNIFYKFDDVIIFCVCRLTFPFLL